MKKRIETKEILKKYVYDLYFYFAYVDDENDKAKYRSEINTLKEILVEICEFDTYNVAMFIKYNYKEMPSNAIWEEIEKNYFSKKED